MAEEKKFPEGIRMFPKHEKQPDFVMCALVISVNELFDYCKKNPDLLTEYNGQKQLKLQMLKSRDGKPYLQVDTWKKGDAPSAATSSAVGTTVDGSDLPF